ncbi:MAG: hypothetical protein HGA46_11215 [Chlorobiaceae bacterium]|nr:hypothetical protein [Chlorobiaceae bacterium]
MAISSPAFLPARVLVAISFSGTRIPLYGDISGTITLIDSRYGLRFNLTGSLLLTTSPPKNAWIMGR